jgi:hypothetical protein
VAVTVNVSPSVTSVGALDTVVPPPPKSGEFTSIAKAAKVGMYESPVVIVRKTAAV